MGVVFLSTASDGDQFYAIKQQAALAHPAGASRCFQDPMDFEGFSDSRIILIGLFSSFFPIEC